MVNITTNSSGLKNILGAFIFGPILLLGSTGLLGWNEYRTARTAAALSNAEKAAVTVSSDKVDPAAEGKIIFTQSAAVSGETLRDEAFGVAVPALRLKREVEMFQWNEKSRKRKRSRSVTYEQVWSSSLIDSNRFDEPSHRNPSAMPFAAQNRSASVQIGARRIEQSVLEHLNSFQPLSRSELGPVRFPTLEGKLPEERDGWFYYRRGNGGPNIGDTRVRFSSVKIGPLSVVGMQRGATVSLYTDPNGTDIGLIMAGLHNPGELFW